MNICLTEKNKIKHTEIETTENKKKQVTNLIKKYAVSFGVSTRGIELKSVFVIFYLMAKCSKCFTVNISCAHFNLRPSSDQIYHLKSFSIFQNAIRGDCFFCHLKHCLHIVTENMFRFKI